MNVGEKRQLAVELNSAAPLGLAVVMMRFDPTVIKVNSVTAGKMFADAKSAPTLTQSTEKGVLLVSVAPGAGLQISGEGALLDLEVEAIAAGDGSIAFDLSNVHLITSNGRTTLLQLAPMSLAVKPAPAAPNAKPASEETSANTPVVSPETQLSTQPAAVVAGLGIRFTGMPAVTSNVVLTSNNLWKIAKQHGVTFAALRQPNPQLRGNAFTIRRQLVVP
jgi:LysM repeat protein